MAEPAGRPDPYCGLPSAPFSAHSSDDAPAAPRPVGRPALPPTDPPDGGATHSDDEPEPEPPARLRFGHFELLQQLPRSGPSVVYKAFDEHLMIGVALKVLYPLRRRADSEIQARINGAARLLCRLRHPNVVRTCDVWHINGIAYVTTDFIPGGNLERHADRCRNPQTAAALVERVARGVHCAHALGVLHEGLKPTNILFEENGEPLVSDFGTAKLRDDVTGIPRIDPKPDTLAYLAPEQVRNPAEAVGPAADVWALGVILYELLTARRPFEGDTRKGIASQICTAKPSRMKSLRPSLDRALERITLRCLEKKPTRRYAGAADLADDLNRWLQSFPPSAKRV